MAPADENIQRAIERSIAILNALNLDNAGGGNDPEDGEHPVPTPGQMQRHRDDEVVNNAGGYVFQVSDESRVRRFLILGTNGGTYYVSEQELTLQNLEALATMIEQGHGGMVLREVVEVSTRGRAPKADPAIFALALLARYQVKDRRRMMKDKEATDADRAYHAYFHQLQQTAFRAVSRVCRIPTHLFAFIKYCDMVSGQLSPPDHPSGWGRSMRKCVAEWYLSKGPEQLALHMTKYKNRMGYTHRDVLRLAHPDPSGNHQGAESALLYDELFGYAIRGDLEGEQEGTADSGKKKKKTAKTDQPEEKKARTKNYTPTETMLQLAESSKALAFIRATIEAGKLKKGAEGERRCVELVQQFQLVREHIPTELLNSTAVWSALLERMPMTALIRSLSKLSAIGLIGGKREENEIHVQRVVEKLTNEQALHKARVHPLAVLLASSVYNEGRGLKGKLEWEVNPKITSALETAFHLAFHNVEPVGQRFLLALDVSGSMSSPIAGGHLSCRTASAAMASIFLKKEPHVECMAFESKFVPLPFTPDWSVEQMCNYTNRLEFGSTDCALPMVWALEERKAFDTFIVYTDSETWAGKVHPYEAIQRYRRDMELPHAKLIVMGMATTEFTIADPNDPGMLDVVGLDASVPELVRGFCLGEI